MTNLYQRYREQRADRVSRRRLCLIASARTSMGRICWKAARRKLQGARDGWLNRATGGQPLPRTSERKHGSNRSGASLRMFRWC